MEKAEKLVVVEKETELEYIRHGNRMEELDKEIELAKTKQDLDLESHRIKNADYKRRDMARVERDKEVAEHKHRLIMISKKR